MINMYENEKTAAMYAPRMYGLDLKHKHLPEIMYVTGLVKPPLFCPIVDDYYSGIATTITLHNDMLRGKPTAQTLRRTLADYYDGERFVAVADELGSGTLESNWGTGTDNMELTVSGSDEHTIVTARFDNLGKGAAGAAVQNMDIMLF
jgi:N-acetyl-gamma-glutamyl-phosphate reductase